MSAWATISGRELRQGDVLDACQIPLFNEDYGSAAENIVVPMAPATVIILTQSCDLVFDQESLRKPLLLLCAAFISLQSSAKQIQTSVMQGNVKKLEKVELKASNLFHLKLIKQTTRQF
jgi:hypothetical protein